MLNNFFDILNVRYLTEHISKINPLLKPYTSEEDEKFELKYFLIQPIELTIRQRLIQVI